MRNFNKDGMYHVFISYTLHIHPSPPTYIHLLYTHFLLLPKNPMTHDYIQKITQIYKNQYIQQYYEKLQPRKDGI